MVTNLDKNAPVIVETKDGNYALTVPPGAYRIDASAPKLQGQSRTVTVVAGSNLTVDFILTAS
jgi:hypothetical protein